MRGIPAATAPRMRFAWATTPCWATWAGMSAWSFFTADPTHCFPECISITRARRQLREQVREPVREQPRDRPWPQRGCEYARSCYRAVDRACVVHGFEPESDHPVSGMVRRSRNIFLAGLAGRGDATIRVSGITSATR